VQGAGAKWAGYAIVDAGLAIYGAPNGVQLPLALEGSQALEKADRIRRVRGVERLVRSEELRPERRI
jgi:hypothetical protein